MSIIFEAVPGGMVVPGARIQGGSPMQSLRRSLGSLITSSLMVAGIFCAMLWIGRMYRGRTDDILPIDCNMSLQSIMRDEHDRQWIIFTVVDGHGQVFRQAVNDSYITEDSLMPEGVVSFYDNSDEGTPFLWVHIAPGWRSDIKPPTVAQR